MDNIRNILKDVIGQIASKNPQKENNIERIWQNVLQPQELEHTHVVGVKSGSILVNVDSPAWLYQMNIRKKKILERLTEINSEIKSISFKIGKVK